MDTQERKYINSLILRIGKGDEDALFSLYKEIGGRMLSVAIGITSDRPLAEDAVQEALLKIVRYAGSFRRFENGYGWICTIVRNESITIVKKYKNHHADIDEFYNLCDARHSHDSSYERADIELAMQRLSAEERQLIWLRYMCDMTVRDIEKELNIPKSTVSYSLKRAEEKLKSILRDEK